MLFSINSTIKMSRLIGFSVVMTLGAGLTACGGGDNDGDSGLAVAVADISTPAAARAHMGTLTQILKAMDMLEQVSGTGNAPASQGGVTTQSVSAAESCSNGGTADFFGPTSKTVGSPYTTKPMSVDGVRFANCRQSLEPFGPVALTLNGSGEFGEVQDGAYDVSYLGFGASRAEPFSIITPVVVGQPLGEVTLHLYLRDDHREHSSNDTQEGQLLFNIDGHYSLTRSGPNGPIVDTGEFRHYIGKTGTPFRISSNDQGTTIQGEYGFAHVGDYSSSGDCHSGAVTVTTEQRLTLNDSGRSPFSAGTLRLSAGDHSATVSFANNNVTIVSGASSATVSYQTLINESAECAGIALTGLSRLGALGASR